jgi:hypothetical protein
MVELQDFMCRLKVREDIEKAFPQILPCQTKAAIFKKQIQSCTSPKDAIGVPSYGRHSLVSRSMVRSTNCSKIGWSSVGRKRLVLTPAKMMTGMSM